MKRKMKQHKSIANKLKKERRNIMVSTPDNWHPSFDGNMVNAALHYNKSNDTWWISFYGDDDYGMNKVFYKYDDAKKEFDSIIKNPVKQQQLKAMGFREW